MIRIALPNKGRLAEPARELLRRAGLTTSALSGRTLQAPLGEGYDAIFVRAADIPEFVNDGAADAGITGRDLVAESGWPLLERADLELGRCRLVVAGPESGGDDVADIPEDAPVATSFPRLAARFFADRKRNVHIVSVSGATEITPHIGVADFIVDLVSTGSTLRTNGLREMATVLESSAVLVSRDEPASRAAQGLRDLTEALQSVVRARDKRYLMANVPRARLDDIRRIVPGLSAPTIVELLNGGTMVATHAVVDQEHTFRAIADLRALGAEGILVAPIERLVP